MIGYGLALGQLIWSLVPLPDTPVKFLQGIATMTTAGAQQLTHHTSSGCPMRVGDLLGSGTISGPMKESRGSLLELSWGGKEPLDLGDGVSRSFIEDGDTLTLRDKAQGDGFCIGFGECIGTIKPAR